MYVCMNVYMYLCMNVYMYVCIYERMMCACMYVCMYVCRLHYLSAERVWFVYGSESAPSPAVAMYVCMYV